MRDTEPVKIKNYKIDKIKDFIYAEGDIITYLIKWERWPTRKYWTWEPFEHFYYPEPLLTFHRKFLNKPKNAWVLKDTL